MIKVSEKNMLKTEIGWKLGLLHQLNQAVKAKEKFFRQIESTCPVYSGIILKQNSLIADKWSGKKTNPATT